jgi:hypothetical protein
VNADVVVLRGFWCHAFGALKAAGPPRDRELPDSNTRLAREMDPERRRCRPRARPRLQPRAGAPPRAPAPRLGGRDLGPDRGERDEMRRSRRARASSSCRILVDVAATPQQSGQDGRRRRTCSSSSRNFAYAPNANAARRLVERVLPLVRRERPGARLCLVGGGMAPGLRAAVTNAPGSRRPASSTSSIRGTCRAAVVLLPVREGAGCSSRRSRRSRAGLATVGFPEAYRGIDADPESAFLTAPDEPAMARPRPDCSPMRRPAGC